MKEKRERASTLSSSPNAGSGACRARQRRDDADSGGRDRGGKRKTQLVRSGWNRSQFVMKGERNWTPGPGESERRVNIIRGSEGRGEGPGRGVQGRRGRGRARGRV